jgi:hypothetical protein
MDGTLKTPEDSQKDDAILEKIKNMIEHSSTKEQLSTAKRFMELFIKDIGVTSATPELKDILLEKEKNLIY